MTQPNIHRRQFLNMSALAAIGVVSGCQPATTTTGSLPSATRPFSELGVQLYTLRSLFEVDFRSVLKTVAEIGFRDLEFAGYYAHDPAEIKAYMDELGLVSHSSHVQLADVEGNFEAVMARAALMGQTNLVIPWIAPELRTLDHYSKLADLMNERGAAARAAGLQIAYHNHDFEFETIDGTVPYDLLLKNTDPDLVKMELDLFWTAAAGVDPLTYFMKAPGRFIACHVKDRRASGDMAPVGDGEIDFDRTFEQAEAAGLKHFYVEHDNPADPIASISASFSHLMG